MESKFVVSFTAFIFANEAVTEIENNRDINNLILF